MHFNLKMWLLVRLLVCLLGHVLHYALCHLEKWSGFGLCLPNGIQHQCWYHVRGHVML